MSDIRPPVMNRDEYEDLLATAAFGTLTSDEAADLRAYLQAHPESQADLDELRELASTLPLLVDEAAPSTALRGRLEQAVQATHRVARPLHDPEASDAIRPLDFQGAALQKRVRNDAPPAWRNYVWAAAAAILIALVAGAALGRFFFADPDDDTGQTELIAYEMDLATPVPGLTAELTYDPERQLFVLQTENMPHAPEGQVYQIWLIDQDSVPQPKGVMDEATFAVTADMDQYVAFAITVEPGPLGSEAPTSTPFFVAPLTPAPEGT